MNKFAYLLRIINNGFLFFKNHEPEPIKETKIYSKNCIECITSSGRYVRQFPMTFDIDGNFNQLSDEVWSKVGPHGEVIKDSNIIFAIFENQI